MSNHFSLSFDPFLPWPVLIGLALIALLLAGLLIWHGKRGGWTRLAACALLIAALTDPRFVNEEREGLPEVVALLVDRSGSQGIGERAAQTDAASGELEQRIAARPNTTLRKIEVFERDSDVNGTHLFEGLSAALADVPPERLAGIVAITDGVVHDVPASLRALGFGAPFHGLITGKAGEFDRRIEIVESPRFGIVGKEVQATVKVRSEGAEIAGLRLTLRRNGEVQFSRDVRVDTPVRLPLKIDRAGINLFEAEIEVAPGELTPLNNLIALPVEGVRDKLRVLLVSGEPHAGERTWRNLLKADPNVDLVHFTILRPPEKQDGTPTSELSLIAFPTRELFQQKIQEFDLIIFDRYSNQTYLPNAYFDNMVRYVREGGQMLFAVGPELLHRSGLLSTPLRQIIPADPGTAPLERQFRARVSKLGERHPVTRKLEGAQLVAGPQGSEPSWAPWFRQIPARAADGHVVMTGAENNPLLVLKREQKGRVALFLSDQVWLWARGYEGGGPYLDLLRRLVHWLMKEPDLEEEALRLDVRGRTLTVERRTIGEAPGDVDLTLPGGEQLKLTLSEAEAGIWRATVALRRAGLYKAQNGTLVAYANAGPANPKEFMEVVSTTSRLAPIAEESGGSMRRLDQGGQLVVPRLVDIRSGGRFGGSDFIGLKPTEASVVRGVSVLALAAGGLGLLLMLVPLIGTWLREGRGRRAT
ncbi:MAG TPA: hypothetical protein PLQ11_07020 [Beijerinckiaceae bacterium]|nr:hypothetical protein [Beijerinckiaceae bacterium]